MQQLTVGVNLLFLHPGLGGGTSTYSWKLVEMLAATDECRVVVFVQRGEVPVHPSPARLRFVWTPRFRSVISRVIYEQTVLPLLAARERVAVLFSPGYVSPLWGPFKRVVTVHDVYYRKCPQGIGALKLAYWKLFIPLSARRSHAVICDSHNTAEDLLRDLPGFKRTMDVVHLASGVEVSDLQPAAEAVVPTPYGLCVSNVSGNKNMETLVRAAMILKHRGCIFPVYVVGLDSAGLLASAIERHSAEGVVMPLGRVDSKTLRSLYQHAYCTIHPSLYEGFGLPALEAQCMGSPLISSRCGSLPEVAGDGALYFDPNDPGELAERVLSLLNGEEDRDSLIFRGKRNAQRFSWIKTARETLAIFHRVLAVPDGAGARR
jgi:glycosyltransferase involved in cell wall biosynthesis